MAILDKIKDVFHKDKSNAQAQGSTSDASASASAPAPSALASATQSDAAGKHGADAVPANPALAAAAPADAPQLAGASEERAFAKEDVTVIFVLGGPGAGKGTQCERIVRDYGFKHLSAGDLLRAEQLREGSTYGAMIKEYITEGKIVPMEVTIKLLENAMRDTLASPPTFPADSPLGAGWAGKKGRFLIDGFPRKMDQALKFDESVCESSFVLFFNTTEAVMLERLLERGKTSGRDDDNRESIVKRFRTFVDTSMPVVEHYRQQDKVEEVDSSASVDEVYSHVQQVLGKRVDTASGNSAHTGAAVEQLAPAPSAAGTQIA